MHVLLLDNYDPHIAILSHFLHELGAEVEVHRNDEIEVDEIHMLAPDKIVLSPGPDEPIDAGISLPLLRELGIEIPMLGIGLGHQALAVAFGGRVHAAPTSLLHTAVPIEHTAQGIFSGLPSPFTVSNTSPLLVDQHKLPDALEVIARTTDGLIMALRHRVLPLVGVQFDPEPGTNAQGMQLLSTFLEQ